MTEEEKRKLGEWSYEVHDYSLTSLALKPIWRLAAKAIPGNVAPNVISLVGFLFLAKAFYLAVQYADKEPKLVACAAIVLIFAHMMADAVDGIHARAIRNDSALGELFECSCDNLGAVFLACTHEHG